MEKKICNKLIRRPKVEEKTDLGCSTIYYLMSRDLFPKPIKVGVRIVAWREAEIDAWIEARASRVQ